MFYDHYLREGDTVFIQYEGSPEKPLLWLLDAVFAIARNLGYTEISFAVKRGEEHWQRTYSPPAQVNTETK